MSRRRVVLGVALGLYFFGLGCLVGTVVERIRFDGVRSARLAELDATTRRDSTNLMVLEKDTNRTAARETGR